MEEATDELGVRAPDPSGSSVEFDTGVYRLEAVKKAAYRFGDRFHVKIEVSDARNVLVRLAPKTPMVDLACQVNEFCNEVLDQELREVVATETEAVRNLLLAQAFSATSLFDELGDEGDYRNDPKHIADIPRASGPIPDQES